MSKQQLYINGVRVDMPADEIKIKVESNLFSDADKVMTAHSYNIALPRTMTNDSVFALAYIPGANTGGRTTHTYLRASLFLDDVPLFDNGFAVLTNVDDKGYNINLYWGLLKLFETIKEEKLNLCDLPASAYWDESFARWIYLQQYDENFPQYRSGMTQEIYNSLESDSKEMVGKSPWILPSVPATTILSDITSIYGLTLHYTNLADERISQLWHPLTTRKGIAKGEEVVINTIVQMHNMSVSGSQYEPTFMPPQNDSQHPLNIIWAPLPLQDTPPTLNHSATNSYVANDCVNINIGNQYARTGYLLANSDIKVTRVKIFGALPYPSVIYIPKLNNRRIASTYDPTSPQPHVYNFDIRDDFSVSAGEDVIVLADEWGEPSSTFQAGILNIQLTIDSATAIQKYFPWSYVRNYPAIEITKYISELLAHIGGCIVGSVATTNLLNIATLDEICENEPISLDSYGVQKIEMTFGDLAQKNVYKHKENNDVGTEWLADGVIYTNDSTLALERTAFDSKFKVPLQGKVLLWEVTEENDEKKASWNNAGDYIAGYYEDANTIANTGQDFASTISEYYTKYEAITARPKTIEVTVRLSVFELKDFDFARPIYIKQLGRNYLVKSLESEKGDIFKLKLVQI